MSTPAGWYPDPTGRHQNRYFDGDDWDDSVADGQAVSTDPVKGGGPAWGDAHATQVISVPSQAPQPPAPGQSADPTQAGPAAAPPPTQPTPAAAPPPGAPGTPVAGVGTPVGVGGAPPPGAPLGTYPGTTGAAGGGSKTGLIVGSVVLVLVVVVAVVLLTQGGDDGGNDTASDSDSSSQPSDEPEDDPSASDLFDDMADDASDSGDSSDDVFGTDDEPADEPEDTTVGGAYPPEVIDNFNSSCTGSGGPADFCQCIIDVLQRDVPYDRFVEIDSALADDPTNIPPELNAAVTECQAG